MSEVQSEAAALALIIGASVFSIVWGGVNILMVSLSFLLLAGISSCLA